LQVGVSKAIRLEIPYLLDRVSNCIIGSLLDGKKMNAVVGK
jgi:hypothetical protein